MIVYCYTNQINNKKYIGQTKNPNQRYNAHKSNHQNPEHTEYDSLFHRALRKYGWDNFFYEVLAETEDIDLANELEIFYINFYNTIRPNGYNILEGGKNASRPMAEITKEKLRWAHGKLTQDEVIFLRLAYANHESPKQIYDQYFKERLAYTSFLNIWSGRRYATVMPEVIQTGRKTKLTENQVIEIKQQLKEHHGSYNTIAKQYGVTRGAIEAIDLGKTWKHVQI